MQFCELNSALRHKITDGSFLTLSVDSGYMCIVHDFGGPVWHAEINVKPGTRVDSNAIARELMEDNERALHGLGVQLPGHEWFEITNRAAHLRRRLHEDELDMLPGEHRNPRDIRLDVSQIRSLVVATVGTWPTGHRMGPRIRRTAARELADLAQRN